MNNWHIYFRGFYNYAKQCGVGNYWASQGAIDFAEYMTSSSHKQRRVTIANGVVTYHNK